MSTPSVVIFRHEMFKRSEPFIVRQAQALRGVRPIYVGRSRFGDAPAGAMHHALWEDRPTSSVGRLSQLISRSPRGYLESLNGKPVNLVHAHFGVDAIYGLPLARSLRVPLVTTFHGFDATMSAGNLLASRKPSWVNYVLRRRELASEGRLFLCVSDHIRRRVVGLGFPEDRIRVHYMGVDTSAILPPANRPDHPNVLHVGRLVEKKGATDLLQAFALLSPHHAEARLQIVGEGPLLGRLRKMADALELGERVDFLGPLPASEVLALMGRAAVLCQPSVTAVTGDTEGLPIVLLEAAARGLPMLSTWHAGIPELIEDGRSGVLVEERSPRHLAAALDNLLSDSAGRRQLAAAARRRVEAEFDLSRQSAHLSDLYRELM